MAKIASISPSMPYASNSPETRGPTTSTRRYSTESPNAPRTFWTASCCAASPPGCSATLISTSSGPPNCCSWMSPSPRFPRLARIDAMSAVPDLARISISVPPLKSMPKFSPWIKKSVIATIESSAEIGKLTRRKRGKSKCVSSGTMRSDASRPKQLTTVSTAIRTPSPMRTKCVKAGSGLDRHALRPLPSHPARDDQAGERERGENRGDDADAKRHGEAAHRPGADIEQHGGGDEGGDVGIQNRRQRALEAGVDRGNRSAPAAQFLADALIDQHVGIDRDADRQHDAGDARQRERGIQQRQHAEDHRDVDGAREIGDHAKQPIGREHEHDHHDRADIGGEFTLLDRILAEAGADGALLDHRQRRRQGAGAQQDRQIVGGLHREAAGNLPRTAGDGLADDGGGNHLIVEHDRKGLPDILGSRLREFARAGSIETEADDRLRP